MGELALYLGKMLVYSGIFAAYYLLVMRKASFIYWNRRYILLTVALSGLLPLVSFPIQVSTTKYLEVLAPLYVSIEEGSSEALQQSGAGWSLTILLMATLYLLVVQVLSAKLVSHFSRIAKLKRLCEYRMVDGSVKVYSCSNGIAPFSFFRSIFMPSGMLLDSEEGQRILRHELEHVHANHSIDKLAVQLVCTVFWFNPFFWIFRKELGMVHEFLADRASVKQGGEEELSRLILSTLYPRQYNYFGNQFYQSPIKRRLAMIAKTNIKYSSVKKLLVIPVIILVACLLTVRLESKPQTDNIETVSYQDVKVKPMFQGDDANAFAKWVSSQIVYPIEAKNKGIQGRVVLTFVVGKDGTLRDIQVVRSVDELLDEEAKRVVSLSPKWTPGKHKGRKVNVRYTFPINYTLSN